MHSFGVLVAQALCDGGEVDFEEKIIYDSSPLFRDTVGAFIDDPKFKLTFKVDNCSSTTDACTDISNASPTGEIIIKIEDIGTDPINIAQMILHESIHAEMARFIAQFDAGIVDVNDRPYLFTLYKYYKENAPGWTQGQINHGYMSTKYIIPIANALRSYDNNTYSEDHYMAFAWDGLRAWDILDGLDDAQDTIYEGYRTTVINNSTVCN